MARLPSQPAIYIAAALILFCLLPLLRRLLAQAGLAAETRAAIDRHLPALIRRRAQLARPDAYGRLQLEKWHKELDYFITHQIAPALSRAEQRALDRKYSDVVARIDAEVDDAASRQPIAAAFSDTMTPAGFEAFCADALRQAGWDARVTLQSRDQGVDVIAEKNRVRVVLQCKLHARAVGNKSVQEAAAGRLHEGADAAAVVSNNRYTPAAEQLAATTGVLLLHYRDLPDLEDRLGELR
jgi:restriction system protein